MGIGHPADVHFFKILTKEFKFHGHKVIVTAREKEFTCYLLDKFHIKYHKISKHRGKISRKIIEYFVRWIRTYKICKNVIPDIAIGVGDLYLPQIGKILGFPTIVFTDTESVWHDPVLTFPFASYVLTPSCFKKRVRAKQIKIKSYKESAYLNDKYFKPNPDIYSIMKLKPNEKFITMRFTSQAAMHNIGQRQLSIQSKIKAVQECSKFAKVAISSEIPLPESLKPYAISIPPEKIHDALYYSELLYGDSSTMSSECAFLGTPSIFVDDVGRGYTDEQQEKYGLVFNYPASREGQEQSIQKCVDLLFQNKDKSEWIEKRNAMIAEQIDLTAFLVWFVENYPHSAVKMQENPEYQYRFVN